MTCEADDRVEGWPHDCMRQDVGVATFVLSAPMSLCSCLPSRFNSSKTAQRRGEEIAFMRRLGGKESHNRASQRGTCPHREIIPSSKFYNRLETVQPAKRAWLHTYLAE